jgi:hypothetical protein
MTEQVIINRSNISRLHHEVEERLRVDFLDCPRPYAAGEKPNPTALDNAVPSVQLQLAVRLTLTESAANRWSMPFERERWLSLRKDPVFTARLAAVYCRLRKPKGTQSQFGLERGVHPKSIERIEQGQLGQMSHNLFIQLAKAVGHTAESLIRLALPGAIVGLPRTPSENPKLSLLRRQEAEILNVPLLPGARVSFRFIWPELIFSAPVKFQRRPRNATTEALEMVEPEIATTAIVGAPGSGKSTALRLTALRLTKDFMDDGTKPFPLLMHAREVVGWSIDGLQMRLRELAIEGGQAVARLVDGLDEVGERERLDVLQILRRAARPGDVTAITCRHDVFAALERRAPAEASFDEVAEILEWDFQENVVPFATGYLNKVERGELAPVLFRACEALPNLRRFVCNPFHLTLTLYLLQAGEPLEESIFVDRYTLYDAFYRQWMSRERRRGTSVANATHIIAAHVEVARRLYRRRLGRVGDTADDFLVDDPSIGADSAFEGLFQWHYDEFADHMRLVAFRHETLLEFILAFGLLQSLISGEGLKQGLLTQYNNDVNSFVREGFARLSHHERKAVEQRLTDLLEPDATDEFGPADAMRIREQAVYYLGRLDVPECPAALTRLAASAPDALLRRAASLGAILHDEERVELEFIHELNTSPEADLLNRSVQLAYFGDVDTEIFDYKDDGRANWAGVRAAIFARLGGSTRRDLSLRLWDLTTLLGFLKSRPNDTINSVELGLVRAGCEKITGSEERCRRLGEIVTSIILLAEQRGFVQH